MKIKLVSENDTKNIQKFFDKNLDRKNKALYSDEFFCPFGVSAAIKRNQVFAIFENEKVLTAVRVYPRKRDGVVSVYQFAVDSEYRGKKFLQRILKFTRYKKFEFTCPKKINFNNYYLKVGAKKVSENEKFNFYILEF
jgi:hypothetical protein